MRHFTLALLLLGASALTSCNKEGDPTPVTPVTPVVNKKIDASQLLGKWEVISFYQLITVDSSGAVIHADGYSETYHENSIKYDPEFICDITFNADKTFDLTNKNNTGGSPVVGLLLKQHGNYEIKNSDTALSMESVVTNSTSSMEDYKVVAFRSDYFHLVFATHTFAGYTNTAYLEFKR